MNYYEQFKDLSKRFKNLYNDFLEYKEEAEVLKSENEALKAENEALKAKIDSQGAKIDTLNKNIDKGLYEIEQNLAILNSLIDEIATLKGVVSENPNDELSKLALFEKDSEKLYLIKCISRMSKSIGRTLIKDWNDGGKYKLVR